MTLVNWQAFVSQWSRSEKQFQEIFLRFSGLEHTTRKISSLHVAVRFKCLSVYVTKEKAFANKFLIL